MRRFLGVLFGLAMLAAACGESGPSVSFGDVPPSVDGNVVTLPLSADGVDIVAADGDTSGETGHFHVFIDGDPVDAGQTIPKEDGIVHSTADEIVIRGLSVGEHTFTLVLGDGTHTRMGDYSDERTVTVDGPSVQASAPSEISFGDTLNVSLSSEGVDIAAADGDTSGDTGHYHVLVDPESPPVAGAQIPAAVENQVIHSTNSTVAISALATGTHELWVVLGDGTHTAFDPAVMDLLTVTVVE